MIIDRLRVQGKLNLLLLLPLAAVVLVGVPFVAGQVGNAQASTVTADAARHARQLGALVWELQRERLVTAGFLADPAADDSAMLLQQQVVADSAESLRQSLGSAASDELTSALVRLGSLAEVRENARHRGIALDSIARAYHAVIKALIDALRLVPQRTSDAEGTRQLTALDALLRANEAGALRGMALVAVAVSPQIGQELLASASAQAQNFTERFVQQAGADQSALVVLVDQGEAARRVDALVQHPPDTGDPDSVRSFAAGARDAAEAQASLRRLVQDQVTSQIADAAGQRAGTAQTVAWTVALGAVLLLGLVLGLAFVVSRSIARPLQRLTRAATTVADLANAELVRVTDVEEADEQPLRLTAIEVAAGDEVGELAVAFNRVQATAAMMLERQAVTRHNVSLMFANVAQRTQNLVRRQLALVDDLEREEQNTELLTRLYRLDHLSTRLRRNAENLLVVAGSRDESRIFAPTPLVTVLRSALAEIEDYQRVAFGTSYPATVSAPLVADLVLVFAELLENATAFSPPQSTVDVSAAPAADGWCTIKIVDCGIGMPAERLAEENRRLVERERLDIVPTSVLGLFVVGRLARRHGLRVALEPTPGGGTTATVAIPPTLYTIGTLPEQVPQLTRAPEGLARRPALPSPALPAASAVPAIPPVSGSFSWFVKDDEPADPTTTVSPTPAAADPVPAAAAAAMTLTAAPSRPGSNRWEPSRSEPSRPVPAAPGSTEQSRRGNLQRRVPGAQLPTAALRPANPAAAKDPVHDASAARTAMDAFQAAVVRAGSAAQAPPPGAGTPAGGLARRTPGAQLAPSLRGGATGAAVRPVAAAPVRDPEAQRAAFDAYAAGLAEAAKQAELAATQDDHTSRRKEGT